MFNLYILDRVDRVSAYLREHVIKNTNEKILSGYLEERWLVVKRNMVNLKPSSTETLIMHIA